MAWSVEGYTQCNFQYIITMLTNWKMRVTDFSQVKIRHNISGFLGRAEIGAWANTSDFEFRDPKMFFGKIVN